MNGRLDYIIGVQINKEADTYSLDGINREGYWYIAGRLSDGKASFKNHYHLKKHKATFHLETVRGVEEQVMLTFYQAIKRRVPWSKIEEAALEVMNSTGTRRMIDFPCHANS